MNIPFRQKQVQVCLRNGLSLGYRDIRNQVFTPVYTELTKTITLVALSIRGIKLEIFEVKFVEKKSPAPKLLVTSISLRNNNKSQYQFMRFHYDDELASL